MKINNEEFTINVNTTIGWKFMKALRQFVKNCDLSSKESYLAWVAQYKQIVKEAEQVQKRLKALRSPGTAMYSKEFQVSLNPEYTGANPISNYEKALIYVAELQSRQAMLGAMLTELYQARGYYKAMSYAKKKSVVNEPTE